MELEDLLPLIMLSRQSKEEKDQLLVCEVLRDHSAARTSVPAYAIIEETVDSFIFNCIIVTLLMCSGREGISWLLTSAFK